MVSASDYRFLGKRTVFDGWIKIVEEDVLLPDKKQMKFQYMHQKDAAIILAVTGDRKIVTVKEFRVPVKEFLRELPGGLIEKGEDPEEAAMRELEEEAGYKAGKIQLLAAYYPLVGQTDMKLYLYFASELKKTKQNLDATEFLDVELVDIDEYKDYLLKQKPPKEYSWLLAILLAELHGLI